MNPNKYRLALPSLAIWVILAMWHMFLLYEHSLNDWAVVHLIVLMLALVLALAPLLLYGCKNDMTRYLEGLVQPVRYALVGAGCFMMGGLHSLTFSRAESVFMQMGFVVILLAYFEVNAISNRFRTYFSENASPVTRTTIRAMFAHRGIMLLMTFVLSAGGLYLALMGVVGFRSVWSVLALVSVMFLLLALMMKVRKI